LTTDAHAQARPLQLVIALALMLTALVAVVPLVPEMPDSGLDASWMFGLNQAVAQGLSFGDQVIFTFGPYSSLFTRSYHPATDRMMMAAGLYLALSLWLSLVLVMRGGRWFWAAAFCFAAVAMTSSRDSILFLQPLLAALAISRMVAPGREESGSVAQRLIAITLVLAPLGLLPLVKGSALVLCMSIQALCVLLALTHRDFAAAAASALSPALSMVVFWTASGQSVVALPVYLGNITGIARGYAQAMSITGNALEIVLYLAASAAILGTVLARSVPTKTLRLFVFLAFAVFLFVAFKAGFIRHDVHALAAGNAVLLAALILPFALRTSVAVLPAVGIALLSWSVIDKAHAQTSPSKAIRRLRSAYSATRLSASHALNREGWLRPQFDDALERLRQQGALPRLSGTTDIYSYNQSYLIASENSWSPRPVFQSYVAYTPALADANRRHLAGTQAPDNVIFRIEPLSEHLPSQEDGPSWPVLLARYRPSRLESDFLLLQRHDADRHGQPPESTPRSRHLLGETVAVPSDQGPILAQVTLGLTAAGMLGDFLFKPEELRVRLQLRNGDQRDYRLIPGMAGAGFVVSPLVENTHEFAMLYGAPQLLDSKQVSSLDIQPADGNRHQSWNREYEITFTPLAQRDPVDVSPLLGLDAFEQGFLEPAPIAAPCQGSIDTINGRPPGPVRLSRSSLLTMDGWMAITVNPPVLPDAVYVVVTDAAGQRRYVRGRLAHRPDVALHFDQNVLENSGFTVTAPLTGFNGEYSLGLAIRHSHGISICPQFALAAVVTP
jgi:hypothetical protein